MEEVWRAIRIGAALIGFELLNEWAKFSHSLDMFVQDHYLTQETAHWIIWGGAILICVLVASLVEVCLKWTSAGRERNRSGLWKFERVWAQRCSIKDRPYSISVIRYSAAQRRWEYYGIGYTADCKPAAEWQTLSLFYDEPERSWYFAGEAWIRNHEDETHGFPHVGGQGRVSPILTLPAKAKSIPGIVADFDIPSPSSFLINLFPVDAKPYADTAAILELKPAEVKQILEKSGAYRS